MRKQKGITLIVLVVTIIILVILAGISIALIFGEDGVVERSKWAKFATEFREVEEKQQLYASGQVTAEYISQQSKPIEERNGLSSIVTQEEKNKIKEEKPSLAIKMKELSGKSINNIQIYWIDKEKVETEQKEKYILDVENNQVYQYEGEEIFGLIWHTLEGGIEKDASLPSDGDELWEGWMKLTLFYPENSTDHKWRIGGVGEVRNDESLQWQKYIEPIWVRVADVENVWIRYKMNGEDIIIPPAGRLLVDIEPNSYYPNLKQSVTVSIHYDKTAELKEYKIGNSDWQEYTTPFNVTENTIVEARAKKVEKLSDEFGELIEERDIWGTDNIYINNIGIKESQLVAPTITKLAGGTGEVAKVHIDYPQGADKLVYKLNYGEEQEYTQDIGITKNGTHVIAYYYDSSGNRSKASSILIEQNGSSSGGNYIPNREGGNASSGEGGDSGGSSSGSNPINPSIIYNGPNISVDAKYNVTITIPTGVSQTEGIKIGLINKKEVTTRADNNKNRKKEIYYKIDNGNYQKYTGSFQLTKTSMIATYYITSDGYRSQTTWQKVYVPQAEKPTVSISLNPNPYQVKYGVTKVTATIIATGATSIEYSLDGIVYQPYTESVELIKNGRIYAKGINNAGETIEYEDITNIGPAPVIPDNLAVTIIVNPEPLTSTILVDTAKVKIDYDKKAEKKYYKLGKNGTLKEYTEPFEVNRNTTIYAYAISKKGRGTDQKMIDNLIDGIGEPKIHVEPSNNKQASQDTVKITFDKNAKIMRYKIDNDTYREYTGAFTVEKNCIITAYNSNSKGDIAESSYEISNMIVPPQIVVIDRGSYYLIKLNYPPTSTGREYKWQENGQWKSYPNDGILLVKTEYKNEILGAEGNLLIQIEDENGNKINFKGDYYFITKPVNELMENIYMRWKNKNPLTPEIVLSTNAPTRQLDVTINYEPDLKKKQYRIVYPDGVITKWKDYTEPITGIDKKNTIIYARAQDETDTWSTTATKKITNIDEESPQLKVTADLENPQQQVGIRVMAMDDVEVEKVKWTEGVQSDSYFTSGGTMIDNNSIVYAQKNGYYTFYAIDGVGNTSIYTLKVENIDLTPPQVAITVTPEQEITTQNKIIMDFGDSTLKQYKIGENNNTWSNYTGEITLTSYTVLANKWQNSDKTVTVYAKGKDTAGNEQIVQKKILNLDLDIPNTPVITSNFGYPVITEYGVIYNKETRIAFDTRTDIENYYSIDNGTTWKKYVTVFEIDGPCTVMAKSIKKISGLEANASKAIIIPADAIGPNTFDKSEATGERLGSSGGNNKIIKVSPEMQGKTIYYHMYIQNSNNASSSMHFRNKQGAIIQTVTLRGYRTTIKQNIKIPENTDNILIQSASRDGSYMMVYTIETIDEPTINVENVYPTITPTGVTKGYNNVSISYKETSVQRLYKIDDEEWKEYKEKIKLVIGKTIYAKGIDKNGEETRIISSYTSALPGNAMGSTVYDNNAASGERLGSGGGNGKVIKVSPEMQGKTIYYHIYIQNSNNASSSMHFRNKQGTILQTVTLRGYRSIIKQNTKIPQGTDNIIINSASADGSHMIVYEIKPII